MRKNASKILGILLAVLMIVGNMTTFATATLAAGETSVTFLDESGNTIKTISFDGSTTVNTLLAADSAEAKLVKKAIAQTDTKVFAGWTLTDGTAFDAAAEITESKTVQASFSKYKVYTAEGLAIEKTAGRLVNTRMLISDTTRTYNVEGESRTFLRITPDESSSYYKRAHLFAWTLEDTLSGYSVMAMNHITNARHKDLSTSSYIYCDVKTNSTTPVYYTNPDTTIIADETTGYATGTEEILATYPVYDGITRFRISPWGAAQFGSIAASSTTGIYPEDYTQTYFDIEYIAFFEKEGAAEYFDYSKYGNFDVTFTDENDNIITTVSAKGTTTISALLEANPADKALIAAATAQTDTRVFMGWTLDGEAFDADTEITESKTIKASFSKYKLYTHADIAGFFDSGNITLGKSTHDTTVTNAFRMKSNSTSSHALNWAIAFDDPADAGNSPTIDSTKLIDNAAATREYEVFVAKYKTNQSATSTENTSWIRIYNELGVEVGADGYSGSTNNDKKRIQYAFSPTGVTEDGTGIDDITAVYQLSRVVTDTKISGFRFAPWSGASITKDTSLGPATDTDYKVAYADIEYFALFEKEDAVEYFDYSLYGKTEYDVNIIGYGSEEPVEAKIQKNKPIPVDGITTQYVDSNGTLMVISGWEIDGETYPVDSYLITGSCTATAVYAPAYIVSEANSTLDGGLRSESEGINDPVKLEEDGVFYQHFTTINGADTVDVSQLSFKIGVGPVLYSENPYVSYGYRTNIERDTWNAAYSINGFSAVTKEDGTKHYGTGKFGQPVAGFVSDNKWNIATHKPESFGTYPDEEKFADEIWNLDQLYLAPWQAEEGITLTGDEYVDIQYIGFFPSETAANNFDIDSYLDSFMVNVTVEIDGVKNEALSGEYFESTVIELPQNTGVAGYLYDGVVVNSVKVPEDDNGDGEVTISVTSRIVSEESLEEYIQSRGDLNNLKKAYEDKGAITVVYIGGSVTAGHGASNKANTWTSLTTKYLKTKFDNVTEFNEAMGGHGSRSAAYRAAGDVIAHEPDIVFIETSQNDIYNGEASKGYDGKYYEYLIRTIRAQLPRTEIVTVYIGSYGAITDEDENGNLVLIEGKHVAAAGQDAIAAAYDIPSIDASKYTFEAIFGRDEFGNVNPYNGDTWAKYYKDATDVHPIDTGYALYARAIEEYLEAALAGDCPEGEIPVETRPDAPISDGVSDFTPEIIPLDSPAVSVDGFELIDSRKSSTFTNYLKLKNSPGSGTVKFSFVGTELGVFMKLPDEDDTGYEGGDPDADQSTSIAGVTVTIDDTVYTEKPKRTSPMMYEGLEDTRHEVTITFTNVPAASCPIYGLMVDGRLTQYTVELTASEGGTVSYEGGDPGDSFKIYAMEGDEITFSAHPATNHRLRAWHDLTNGQITPVTDPDGNPYPADNIPETITYKVTGDALINANFVPNEIAPPARLVAFIDRGNRGTITHKDSDITYIDDYVSASEPTTLTAKANDGYVAAYWKRLTQDSDVEVFVSAGAEAGVYALGGYVFYQPVFLTKGETVTLYISGTTNEILSINEAPSTEYEYGEKDACSNDVVSVYVCTKRASANDGNLFTAYDINEVLVGVAQTPVFGENIVVKKTQTNATPLWTLVVGEQEYVASYKDNFSFNYMFAAGTAVEVYEKALEGAAVPTVSTVASWTEDGQAKFTGLFALPAGYELVNHGIMMSKDEDDLLALADNETGEISVFDGTVIGRVRDNTENATPLFTVSKVLASESDKWYGRAFLVYKDAEENTHLVYASTTSTTIAEGNNDGDQVFYTPVQIGE